MFGKEKELAGRLAVLAQEYGLIGIKAEFEAEGSSFEDLVRLRRLTAAQGIALHLKIGGVEAFRDIKDALTLGVDGLIAPMVESAFGLRKFLECVDKIWPSGSVRLAINVETRHAVTDLESILAEGRGRIDGITIGRTDLSASWMDPAVTPDCGLIMDTIRRCAGLIGDAGLELTVGGSIQAASLPLFAGLGPAIVRIKALETRKVMLPAELLVSERGPAALREALAFEQGYIESKRELTELFLRDETVRLEKLARRA
jgi:hypothetical protein